LITEIAPIVALAAVSGSDNHLWRSFGDRRTNVIITEADPEAVRLGFPAQL
jgi:hypothetical protein